MIQTSPLIKTLIAKFSDSPVKRNRILHGGDVNQVYRVTTGSDEFVVRMNKPEYLEEFRKEWYCYQEVAKLGIPTPKLYGIGTEGEYAYEVISYIAPKKNFNKLAVWRKLGEYARICAKIKDLPERSNDTAEKAAILFRDKYLAYDIAEMTEKDFLLKEGIYTQEQQLLILEKLKNLQGVKFEFGLIHGDINWGNLVVGKDDTVYLIDWGSADIDLVPEREISLVYKLHLLDKRISYQMFEAFLEGIRGSKEFKDKEQITNLLFLYLMDKLRWAKDKNEKTAFKDYLWQFKKLIKLTL